MNTETRALLIFVFIGLVAGFIASLLVGGGGGILRYLITGLIGAFVGGYLFDVAQHRSRDPEPSRLADHHRVGRSHHRRHSCAVHCVSCRHNNNTT